MTLSVPLTVRLRTSRADTHVEAEVRDLTFRTSIPGGFASAALTLDRPLNVQPDDIEMFGSLIIYDGRHGGVIWEGEIEDPGRGAGDDGTTYSLSAAGPAAHARDRTAPYILVDRSLERWHRSWYSTSKAKTDTGEMDDETPCLIISVDEGSAVTQDWVGDWIYRSIWYAGQRISRVRADHVEDGASSNYQVGVWARNGNDPASYTIRSNWITSPGIIGAFADQPDDTGDAWGFENVASLRAIRTNSATTADDKAVAHFYNVVVRAQLKNADGSDITDGARYTVNNVDPVEAVADMLGRFLPKYDGANAVLIGSGVDIEQLAYPDGVTPAEVLDDLATYDPAFYWAAWESNAAGRYRFEYVPWPTTVRYEATIVDGFDSPGSGAELYNRVSIRWRDPKGRVRNTYRTQTVPELANAAGPFTREFYIDLSDETGTLANAQYVGDNFLAEHRYPPNAGTLRVARPILDNLTGRMVMPWEIVPGHLIRVRGVLPRVDSLNPTARDGVTVFKLISTEFSASDVSATLELDSYSRTVARALASLKARRLRKR